MATTTLLPLHVGKGRTIAEAITDSTDYAENPLKTQKGDLVTGYECDPMTADSEFLISKRQYFMLTGRDQGDHDVIAYHTRQSFKPGEITPEEANECGRALALRFTHGKHAFIVATHIDKAHIHNHIIFNSTRLDHTRKFRNFKGSSFVVRRISDQICMEHRLSVILNPKPSRGSYANWIGDEHPPSDREKLRRAIDEVLEKKLEGFEAFLSAMEALGFKVKRGKHLAFLVPGAEKYTRCREKTMGADYTEEAIRGRITGERAAPASVVRRGGIPQTDSKPPSLLIDIQARIQAGKGPGFERWARLFNLHQASQSLIYLQEHGDLNYDGLAEKTAEVTARFNYLSDRMKELERSLSSNAELQKHLVNYSKTRDTYIAYRKAGYSKKFKGTHMEDILLHQAAKAHFDKLGLRKLPNVKSLRAEYAVQLDEKKRLYRDYRQARDEMKELLVVKANIDRLLDIPAPAPERKPADRDL